jgi:hypothetical protein
MANTLIVGAFLHLQHMNKLSTRLPPLFMFIFCYILYQAPFLYFNINAHIFVSSDDNASFLTLIERVRIEALLANESLHSNLTSSNEHLAQLLDRLDDVIDNENYFVVKSEQFNNSTVDALFLANIVDEILQYYGGAYGILPSVMLNMSSMSSMASMPTSLGIHNVNASRAFDIDKYQTAKQYASRAVEIFDAELKPYETKKNSIAAGEVEKHLTELKNAVDNKAPPLQVMMIVHTKIHPNLQLAYNLKVRNK